MELSPRASRQVEHWRQAEGRAPDPSGVKSTGNGKAGWGCGRRGFVFRPPAAVVDTSWLERAFEARDPAWREALPFAGPLPDEALAALELAGEMLR